MKRNTVGIFCLAATLLLGVATVAAPAGARTPAQARSQGPGTCSTAAVAGVWGHSATGTLIRPTGPAPFAVVGRTTWDAKGNISGTQTASVGGQIAMNTIKGTATVNPDCTGTQTVSLYDPSGTLIRSATWSTVFVNNASEVRAIMTSLTVHNPDGTSSSVPAIVTMNASKLFPDRGNAQ